MIDLLCAVLGIWFGLGLGLVIVLRYSAVKQYPLCTVLVSDRYLNLTGTPKIDNFRSAIWFRSAILIPNPIPNRSRCEPNNNFSVNSLLSIMVSFTYVGLHVEDTATATSPPHPAVHLVRFDWSPATIISR